MRVLMPFGRNQGDLVALAVNDLSVLIKTSNLAAIIDGG
ncbi:hypothetical protein SOHN41_01458 [Shewanella sp. HN-41]|nr:hypothetical protein SOHN41_01458 [Shewanella sp. HN-41]